MADEELIRLAGLHGVAARYTDWRGREVAVSPDTLAAVLGALGVDASTPGAVRDGLERAGEPGRALPPNIVVRREAGPVTGLVLAELRRHLGSGEDAEVDVRQGAEEVLAPPGADVPGAERPFEPLVGLADVPSGWHRLRVRRGGRTDETRLLVAPVAPAPPRAWDSRRSCTRSVPAGRGGSATCAIWRTSRRGAAGSWARASSWSTRCTRRSRSRRSGRRRTRR